MDEDVQVHTKVQFDKLKESENFGDLNEDAGTAKRLILQKGNEKWI